MVDIRADLTARQVEVLRWVANGCPIAGMADVWFKHTARALQTRRLVRTGRSGGAWQATLTDVGRHYLAHGSYPDREQPAGRQAEPVERPTPSRRTATAAASVPRPVTPPAADLEPVDGQRSSSAPLDPAARSGQVTAELVLARLRDASGELVLSGLGEQEFAEWRRAAKVAQLRLLRAGRQRLHRWTEGGTLRLRLDAGEPPEAVDRVELSDEDIQQLICASRPPPVLPRTAEFLDRRVPVPSKVTTPHPAVDELIEAAGWPDQRRQLRYGRYPVSLARRRPIVRMRRLWQALITEALFRGYKVRVDHNRRDDWDTGRLVIRIGRDEFPITLHGDSMTPLRLRVVDEQRRRERTEGVWVDVAGSKIEQRLGEVFTHIERRAEEAIEDRAEQHRRDQERRRQWQTAMAEARCRFAEQHRRDVIACRIADVAYCHDVRGYAAALRQRAAVLPEPRGGEVLAWAAWAEQYAQDIDPLRGPAATPVTPEPEPDQLKPYLGWWSPYGP